MKEEIISIIESEFGAFAKTGSGILLIIISISYISAILLNVIKTENQDAILFASVCLICVPLMQNILSVVSDGSNTINNIKNVMISSIPGLCASNLGNSVSSAITFISITQIAAMLLCNVFMPLTIIYTILGICQSLCGNFNINGLKGSVRFVFNWGLGIMMLIFSCVGTLSGVLTGAKVNLASRSLKYTGAMIPIVGRYLAESADMVFASAAVIKGTAGTLAISTIIISALAPCIKMTLYVLTFKLAAILINPVADAKITNAIINIGDAYMMITGITALMSVMSIMNIAILISIVTGG